MGSIKPNTRELLLDTFYGLYRKDVDAVVASLTQLGIIVPTSGDTVSVRKALGFFIENINREVKEKEAVKVCVFVCLCLCLCCVCLCCVCLCVGGGSNHHHSHHHHHHHHHHQQQQHQQTPTTTHTIWLYYTICLYNQVIGEDLFAIALDQPFRFPASFTFVLRAFSTLEGIGKALDPKYSFIAVAQPYAQELLDLQV